MKAYIRSAGVISPQYTYNCTGFPEIFRGDFSDRLACIEPEYQSIVNPIQLRRMPRILKMGLGASRICIANSNNTDPEAIIIGTGLGCLNSLEKFLDEVIETKEQIRSVLPFINSTHNAVAAQIAMMLNNNSYNVTYCHRGFSFESALADAIMHIEEGRCTNILIGGIDEVTDDFITLHRYSGLWKEPLDTLKLISSKTRGTIPGEGAAFFIISCEGTQETGVIAEGVHTFFNSDGAEPEEIFAEADIFLEEKGIGKEEIDAVILGINGDAESDENYYRLLNNYFAPSVQSLYYKHLCGEYYTSTSFALWVAKTVLETQSIPEVIRLQEKENKPVNKILIYNHFQNKEHSFMIVGID